MNLFGGIEAGGTKFVCGFGTGPGDLTMARFPTTSPEETLASVIRFLKQEAGGDLRAVGIGSFGPVDLDRNSPTFGYITSTPKPGWSNCNLAGTLEQALGVPTGFDTDVNAAALGEAEWGAGRGLSDLLYLTVGTGIGGGAIVGGRVMHGLVHPEMGHIRIPHDWTGDPYAGACPYHGDCLEGLASGTAMKERWGAPAEQLPPGHAAWSLEARYLALAAANLALTLSPQRIVLGGGVLRQPRLFAPIRDQFLGLLNGYVRHPALAQRIEEYIVPPELGGRAGILGALVLARDVCAPREVPLDSQRPRCAT
ncbi:MAG: ROK family protein [Bryobacteraceae bacterium]